MGRNIFGYTLPFPCLPSGTWMVPGTQSPTRRLQESILGVGLALTQGVVSLLVNQTLPVCAFTAWLRHSCYAGFREVEIVRKILDMRYQSIQFREFLFFVPLRKVLLYQEGE